MQKNMIIDKERQIITETSNLYNDFLELFEKEDRQHDCDVEDVAEGIHILQSVIMRRIARRDCPDIFPTYN